MSPLVKTKRQANFKDFKRFGVFKGVVEQKKVVFNLFMPNLHTTYVNNVFSKSAYHLSHYFLKDIHFHLFEPLFSSDFELFCRFLLRTYYPKSNFPLIGPLISKFEG
jgi:hypothetical protein